MLSKNKYYKMLKVNNKDAISFILVFTIIIFAQIIVGLIFRDNNWARLVDGEIIFSSKSSIVGIMMIFIYGVILSYSEFNGAMSIKADRISFIKTSAIMIILISIILPIITISLDFIFKYVIEMYSGYKVRINDLDSLILLKENTTNYDLLSEPINVVLTILNSFLNLLVLGLLGFMVGAIVYRVRKMTLVFFGIILSILFISSIYSIDWDTIELLMTNAVSYLIENPMISILSRIFIIILSSVASVLLLKKAPIKDYAHDLL